MADGPDAERMHSAFMDAERALSVLQKSEVPYLSSGKNVPFSLLADPDNYKPHTFDYIANRNEPGKPDLQAWVEVFRNSRPQFHKMAMEDKAAYADESERKEHADNFLDTYEEVLKGIEREPTKPLPGFGKETVNCISLSAMRDRCLRDQGFKDAFHSVKGMETDTALKLLPKLLNELDSISDDRERWTKVLRGVIAGNIFDLGAKHGADLFNSGKMKGFAETRDDLAPRPWCIDDLDAAVDDLTGPTAFKRAVIFCDNAGCDVVLGIIPFARELTKRGTSVIIAANGIAAINDVTAEELRQWITKAAQQDKPLDRAVREKVLQVISTKTSNCVIDLRSVSVALSEEAKSCDLVVLEGMGRGIETNLWAEFKVASLKLGMIKHREVAMELDGDMFGCVCKYMPGSETKGPQGGILE